jgi:hypothetical protein
MGFLIFLLIVAGIVAIVVAVKNNKHKAAIKELKESVSYSVALKIKEELNEKGYKSYSEPSFTHPGYDHQACGSFSAGDIRVTFSNYEFALDSVMNDCTYWEHGIKNPNLGIVVHVRDNLFEKDPTGYLTQFKIAAEVMEKLGYGSSPMIPKTEYHGDE